MNRISKNTANKMETEFVKIAIEKVKELKNIPWYKFKKRNNIKKDLESARQLIIRYGTM